MNINDKTLRQASIILREPSC